MGGTVDASDRPNVMMGGLRTQTYVASGMLAFITGATFVVLFFAVTNLRASTDLGRQARLALGAADELEKLVLDLETGVRGFVITGAEPFLQPWNDARVALSEHAATLERLVADDPPQLSRARRLVEAITSYIEDYSVPLVDAVRRDDPSVRSVAQTEEGKRRVDAIRSEFDEFAAAERALLTARGADAAAAAHRALVVAGVGVVGSIVLITLFAGYLTRGIVLPVRKVALMADRLAGGDLATRMPESASGEVGTLERSFNTMARSLEEGRDELARLAVEQAALRHVATLVARGAPPADVFAAVAQEVGRVLHVDLTHMMRYMPDGTGSLIASWSDHDETLPMVAGWTLEGRNVAGLVLRTEQPARIDDHEDASGGIAARLRGLDIRSSVGGPIVVNGRLWGVMIASSRQTEPLPPNTESHIAAFTELVATAISNAQAQAELAASRVRIVAATDETRRSVERDLHDGIQQRLVSLGLELRAAGLDVPSESEEVVKQISHVADGLEGALEDLREISRGIHPAILSEGGLVPAIKALARRSPVPCDLNLHTVPRLPERIEVAAYYVVSEALANTAKHAEASTAHIDLEARDDVLLLSVRDDGIGGADFARGSGLIGLTDRVEALGGTIAIESPTGEGTTMVVELPLGSD